MLADVSGITVNGESAEEGADGFHIIVGESQNQVVISVTTDNEWAVVTINGVEQNPATVPLTEYGDKVITITVTPPGGAPQTCTLTVTKPIPFNMVVKMRWNNTLTVINNPANNGGYTFVTYQWYRNNQPAGTDQSWSAGANGESIHQADRFYLVLETKDRRTLRTTETAVTLKSASLKAYPNPVAIGQSLHLDFDIDLEMLQDAVIEVYNMHGRLVETWRAASLREIPIDGKYASGMYVFAIKGKDGFSREIKLTIDN